jgi:hypothetical protein
VDLRVLFRERKDGWRPVKRCAPRVPCDGWREHRRGDGSSSARAACGGKILAGQKDATAVFDRMRDRSRASPARRETLGRSQTRVRGPRRKIRDEERGGVRMHLVATGKNIIGIGPI